MIMLVVDSRSRHTLRAKRSLSAYLLYTLTVHSFLSFRFCRLLRFFVILSLQIEIRRYPHRTNCLCGYLALSNVGL